MAEWTDNPTLATTLGVPSAPSAWDWMRELLEHGLLVGLPGEQVIGEGYEPLMKAVNVVLAGGSVTLDKKLPGAPSVVDPMNAQITAWVAELNDGTEKISVSLSGAAYAMSRLMVADGLWVGMPPNLTMNEDVCDIFMAMNDIAGGGIVEVTWSQEPDSEKYFQLEKLRKESLEQANDINGNAGYYVTIAWP